VEHETLSVQSKIFIIILNGETALFKAMFDA
jgi:hypothetical protein